MADGPDRLQTALQEIFGFNDFRPGQRECIEAVTAGRCVMTIMPTGAGKSLCYQLPAAIMPGVTLVVSPLIALMKDQVDAILRRECVRATFINSALSSDEQRHRRAAMCAGEYQLVYVSPERFRQRTFVDDLRQVPVKLFVVDEAHCISEWGHDFRPDYLRLNDAIQTAGNPAVLALTATATRRVRSDIEKQLGVGRLLCIITGFDRPNLVWEVRYSWDEEDKLRHLADLLRTLDGSGIVYVGTRRDAEEVALFCETVLSRPVAYYHGGVENHRRTAAHEAFMSGATPLFVATKAFGLGIDKPDIRFIIHYSLPDSLEAYYQEAGRAGRDGEPARCVLIYLPQDRALQEYFISKEGERPQWCRQLLDALMAVARDGKVRASRTAMQDHLGLREEQIAVAMDTLQRLGVLTMTESGGACDFRLLGRGTGGLFTEIARQTRRQQQVKQDQLAAMVGYAETGACRRRNLLQHFGDRSRGVPIGVCCDNCRPISNTGDGATPETTRVAHVILTAVAAARPALGRDKICGLLTGSKAKWVKVSGVRGNPAYGKLEEFTQAAVQRLLFQLMAVGYLKIVGGEYPVVKLTPQGWNVLEGQAPAALELPATRHRRPPSRLQEATREETYRLFAAGNSPEAIAQLRGLTLNTVEGHIAALVLQGRISAAQLVPADLVREIAEVAARIGWERLRLLKDALPETVTYGQIQYVVNDLRRRAASAAGMLPDMEADGTEETDPIAEFLRCDHPQALEGNWDFGFALGHNSRFVGGLWQRTKIGELLHDFKYRESNGLAPVLAERLAQFVMTRREYDGVDLIVPVPSTTPRSFDPVGELCRCLGERLKKEVVLDVLVRIRPTAPQKEMNSPVQKRRNIGGVLCAATLVAGSSVLLVDDFYDSGETLREATRALKQAGAEGVLVLTLGKTIHH